MAESRLALEQNIGGLAFLCHVIRTWVSYIIRRKSLVVVHVLPSLIALRPGDLFLYLVDAFSLLLVSNDLGNLYKICLG